MFPNKLANTSLITLPTTPGNVETSNDIPRGKPPRRVAAASRKKTKDEAPKRSGKLGQAVSKQNSSDRDAAAPARARPSPPS